MCILHTFCLIRPQSAPFCARRILYLLMQKILSVWILLIHRAFLSDDAVKLFYVNTSVWPFNWVFLCESFLLMHERLSFCIPLSEKATGSFLCEYIIDNPTGFFVCEYIIDNPVELSYINISWCNRVFLCEYLCLIIQ